MIETPTATAFKVDSDDSVEEVNAPLLSQDQKSEKMKLVESDLYIVKQKPITAKLRTAVKHLTAQGGRWARFRGLQVWLIYFGIHNLIVNLFAGGASHPLVRPFIAVITSIALCRLHMTWTHIVISAPSTKHWWQRIPSINAGKKVIIPTAVFATAAEASIYVPAGLFVSVHDILRAKAANSDSRVEAQKLAVAALFIIGLLALGIVLLIVIPANVTLKRVEASMLPEEDEAIVPFDRTFAGKVKPEILGGSGAVGMLDAWKTFDRSARIRLLKLYAKVFAIQTATVVMFIFVVVTELRWIMGDNLAEVGRMAQANFRL